MMYVESPPVWAQCIRASAPAGARASVLLSVLEECAGCRPRKTISFDMLAIFTAS